MTLHSLILGTLGMYLIDFALSLMTAKGRGKHPLVHRGGELISTSNWSVSSQCSGLSETRVPIISIEHLLWSLLKYGLLSPIIFTTGQNIASVDALPLGRFSLNICLMCI